MRFVKLAQKTACVYSWSTFLARPHANNPLKLLINYIFNNSLLGVCTPCVMLLELQPLFHRHKYNIRTIPLEPSSLHLLFPVAISARSNYGEDSKV